MNNGNAVPTTVRINFFYVLLFIVLILGYGAFYYRSNANEQVQEPTTLITESPSGTSSPFLLEALNASSTEIFPTAIPSNELAIGTIMESGEASDTTPPSTPTNLRADLLESNQIVLRWSPSTDDRGVKGYRIYKESVEVGTTMKTLRGFINLTPGTTYVFGISAFDAEGNNSKVRNILLTTPEVPAPTPEALAPTTPTVAPTQEPVSTPAPEPISFCGNGVQDRNEQCDDGNQNDNDMCTNTCSVAYCRDGIVNYQLEQCDDGNEIDNDYCTNACMNNVPTTPAGTETATTNSGATQTGTTGTPTTYAVSVTSSGNYTPTSLALKAGDSITFTYVPPIGDEISTVFTPNTISSIKLDHDTTQSTKTFSTAGTWTFEAKDSNGNQGTIVVQ